MGKKTPVVVGNRVGRVHCDRAVEAVKSGRVVTESDIRATASAAGIRSRRVDLQHNDEIGNGGFNVHRVPVR